MATAYYERLSAMDAMFLEIEDARVHMHIGSVAVFEAAALLRADGGLDVERVLSFAEAQLHKSPRLRQKLATIAGFEHPVWVDDARFNLTYHVRHTALPAPGDERQLKRLAGRILSQQLDREKPLWEVWFVEGLGGDRFGVITKLHHCMADGVSSGDLLSMLMGVDPDYRPGAAPAWIPRDRPSPDRLVLDEIARRATGPLALLGGTVRERNARKGDEPANDLLAFVRTTARGAWRAAQAGLRPATITPLNVEIGPHRRFDWTRVDLAEVKRIGRMAGGTVNDAVLALVAGAVRGFLERRGSAVDGIEFRVAVPVSVRSDQERGQLGNRVSSLIATLPVDEADPWRRLIRVVDITRELKGSGESQAVDLVSRIADWLPLGVMASLSRAGSRAVNMVVTNVPGSPVPVYMIGARMLASYPVVPLMPNEALNIAIVSYDGGLYWGFNADWDAVPDLRDVAASISTELDALEKGAPAS